MLLCDDRLRKLPRDNELELSEDQAKLLWGNAHILWLMGSYSTSHAETLAGISGLQTGSLMAVRLAELHHVMSKLTVPNLLMAQDCRDFAGCAVVAKQCHKTRVKRLYGSERRA